MAKFKNLTRDILKLTKAEIVLLEVITLAAGFLIGQSLENPIDWILFLNALLGTSFLALGSGALNQIQEHREDALMDRTRSRPIPSGRISLPFAWFLSILLFALGILFLQMVSLSVLLLGVLAVVSYNGLYTMWWKRKLAFAAIPGAIPGALPILIGFQAAVGDLADLRGYYLFAILFFWQMPHFWVLALKYSNDYDQGGFPTLPVAKGSEVTRFQITLWCLAYAAIGLLSVFFFPTGIPGLVGSLLVSSWLLFELHRFLKQPEKKSWLRFFLSVNFSLLLYLFVISADLWSILLHPKS
ncbi:MAG: heme o synthase [Bdellovibrionales bacterium]|nr:heme o synthase [Bdellovibrionales bacterium]